jgi:hypothetical protein
MKMVQAAQECGDTIGWPEVAMVALILGAVCLILYIASRP